jgi:AcrR family transcriptional regulator
MTDEPAPPRAAGRPRNASVDRALLQATRDLLLEIGFERLSIEGVAARAGAGKSAIYRRWGSKTELVVAAVQQEMVAPPVPDTGDLGEDLRACARAYQQRGPAQRLLAVLLTELVRNAELRDAAQASLGDPFDDLFVTVLNRAVRHGEIASTTDVPTIAAIFPTFAFHRITVEAGEVDDDLVDRVVDGCVLPLLQRG